MTKMSKLFFIFVTVTYNIGLNMLLNNSFMYYIMVRFPRYNSKTIEYRGFLSKYVVHLLFMSADLSVSWHYVVTLRRGRTRPREQLLLQNYKA